MENLPATLHEHPFFAGFPLTDIDNLAEHAREVHFYAGEKIFSLDDAADTFYLIEKGLVALEVPVDNYGAVTVEFIGAQDVLGWSWLFPPFTWHFDARARQATTAIVFPARVMHNLLEKDLEFAYRLVKRMGLIVVNRLQATRHKLLEFSESFPKPDTIRPSWQVLLEKKNDPES